MFIEKPVRTLIKTISWRIIALVLTVIAFYLYTGNLKGAMSVGILVNIVKMGFYYFHERMWNKIDFGREEKPQPEYNI